VDAISINQNDENEKDSQVRLMGEIYMWCSMVLIWLGEGTEESVKAFKLMENYWDYGITYSYQVLDKDLPAWTKLARLLEHPWFTRKWVVQEISQAPRASVHCGKNNFNWEGLVAIVDSKRWNSYLSNHRGVVRLNEPVDSINQQLDFERVEKACTTTLYMHMSKKCQQCSAQALGHGGPPDTWNIDLVPLVDLMHETRHLGCSDPRDRLFAISGLSKEFRITYSSISRICIYSMTEDRFFSALATYMIDKKRDLIILDFVDHVKFHDTTKYPNLPSWASEFGPKTIGPGRPDSRVPRVKGVQASLSEDKQRLSLMGILLGQISGMGTTLPVSAQDEAADELRSATTPATLLRNSHIRVPRHAEEGDWICLCPPATQLLKDGVLYVVRKRTDDLFTFVGPCYDANKKDRFVEKAHLYVGSGQLQDIALL
jgi:Heterokaryon incompatibility protein (HET)